jgi:hypothetical protein
MFRAGNHVGSDYFERHWAISASFSEWLSRWSAAAKKPNPGNLI